MSTEKSPFIEFQDLNNDGQIDECEDLVEEAPKECPPCQKNPNAMVPDWKTTEEPFFNEQTCEYWVPWETNEFDTGYDESNTDEENERILERIANRDENKREALISLLRSFNKKTSEEVVDALMLVFAYNAGDEDWYLNPSSKWSKLKFLYVIPSINFDAVEDETVFNDQEDIDSAARRTVEYDISDLRLKLIKTSKALNMYGRYQKVAQALDGVTIKFGDDVLPPRKRDLQLVLDDYGDPLGGPLGKAKLDRILPELSKFAKKNGWDLNSSIGTRRRKSASRVQFGFTENYELQFVRLFQEGCEATPQIFGMPKIADLRNQSPYNDPTALSYLARLNEMTTDLDAREPDPWIDFIRKYTFPKVVVDYGTQETRIMEEMRNCFVSDLELDDAVNKITNLIFAEGLKLSDLIAYDMNKRICSGESEPSAFDWRKNPQLKKQILQLEASRAAGELDADDSPFLELCTLGFRDESFISNTDIAEIWRKALDRIKICGLERAQRDAVRCLFGALSLEDALQSVVSSALKELSADNFGDFFIGLPAEKQAEIQIIVEERLREENVLFFELDEQERRRFNPTSILVDREHLKLKRDEPSPGADLDCTDPDKGCVEIEDKSENRKSDRRTIGTRFSNLTSETYPNIDRKKILGLYAQAILEVYADGEQLLVLVDRLNKYPGARLLTFFVATIDCAMPPLFNPPVVDFINDLELPFCRDVKDITLPRPIVNPFGWMPSIGDWLHLFTEIAKENLLNLVMKVIMQVFAKLCEVLGKSLCEIVGVAGAPIGAALTSGQIRSIPDLLRDNLCGEDIPDDEIDDILTSLFGNLDADAAQGMNNRDKVIRLLEDISSSITRKEAADLFLGSPSNDSLDIISTVVQNGHPSFAGAFGNPDSIRENFRNVGNLLPADFKVGLRGVSDFTEERINFPANPSICPSDEALEDFCSARNALLQGRMSTAQIQAQCDGFGDSILDDLNQISDVMQKGMSNYIADNMPPLFSDPGCDNGMFSRDTEESITIANDISNKLFDMLEVDHTQDVLGNGPGKENWGYLNYILSDTLGMPYTAHRRKSFNQNDYVDYFGQEGSILPAGATQEGAFPVGVAEWLQNKMSGLNVSLSYNNTVIPESSSAGEQVRSVRRAIVKTDSLPSWYEWEYDVLDRNDIVVTWSRPAFKDYDLSLEFLDNAKGVNNVPYGFQSGMNLKFSAFDVVQEGDDFFYLANNGSRVSINEKTNQLFPVIRFGEQREMPDLENPIVTTEVMNFQAQERVDFELKEFITNSLNMENNIKFNNSTALPLIYMNNLAHHNATKKGISVNNLPLGSQTLKIIEDYSNTLLANIFAIVSGGENNVAFKYGFDVDDLSSEDTLYVNPDADPNDESTWEYTFSDEDGVLGVSIDQLKNGDAARVVYLDPAIYGGRYTNPPLYIKPFAYQGWLGLSQIIAPEFAACEPREASLINFDAIKRKVNELSVIFPDDERMQYDPECVVEKPFDRILSRTALSGLYGLILATIQIFATEHMMRGMATFSKFQLDFENSFSSIYSSYIIEDMEMRLKAAGRFDRPFRDATFWYQFLEQVVQVYNLMSEMGEIDPTEEIAEALKRIGDYQEAYKYPQRQEFRDGKRSGDIDERLLKTYRRNKNIEAIRDNEKDAKLILKAMVESEVEELGIRFAESLAPLGFAPPIKKLSYYLISVDNPLIKGSKLTLNQELVETIALPLSGSGFYTSGGEFSLPNGQEYVGYYHVHTTDENEIIYMVGEEHTTQPHDVLTVSSDLKSVNIGDVENIGSSYDAGDFVIEKYIAVEPKSDNTIFTKKLYSPDDFASTLRNGSLDQDSLISDNFGNLELIYPNGDTNKNPIGIKGTIGVRYGLRVSYKSPEAGLLTMASVELDVLDTPLKKYKNLDSDSVQLLCMVNKLVESPEFKVLFEYVIPSKKLLSLVAVYNSKNFYDSLGQIADSALSLSALTGEKAGISIVEGLDPEVGGKEGWQPYLERMTKQRRSLLVRGFDQWDQETLLNSSSRIKKLFKAYYDMRDFDNPSSDRGQGPVFQATQVLKESFSVSSAQDILPWYKLRNLLDVNPFNSKGKLCESDED